MSRNESVSMSIASSLPSSNDMPLTQSSQESMEMAASAAEAAPFDATQTRLRSLNYLLLRQCKDIFDEIMKHEHAWLFLEPVDVSGAEFPDYLDIIKDPIDFNTIKTRYQKGFYESPAPLCSDIRRAFTNAMRYFGPYTHVYKKTKAIALCFERQLAKRMDIRPAMRRILKKRIGTKAPMEPVAKRPKLEESAIIEKSEKEKKKSASNRKAKLTRYERRNLCTAINTLPWSKLQEALGIIFHYAPNYRPNRVEMDSVVILDLQPLPWCIVNELIDLVEEHNKEQQQRQQQQQQDGQEQQQDATTTTTSTSTHTTTQ